MKVAIFGAGGHGKVVLDILLDAGTPVVGFIDEDAAKRGMKINGFEVLGNLASLAGRKGIAMALGIGNNRIPNRYRR